MKKEIRFDNYLATIELRWKERSWRGEVLLSQKKPYIEIEIYKLLTKDKLELTECQSTSTTKDNSPPS